MGGEAISAMCIAVLPYASDDIMESQLQRLLSGACQHLASLNPPCALIGGHTSEGKVLVVVVYAVGSAKANGSVQLTVGTYI